MTDQNGHLAMTDALHLEPVQFAERVNAFAPVGSTGLMTYGGIIVEDPTDRLTGIRWHRTIAAMLRNSTIKGCLLAVELLIRRAEWTVEPAQGEDIDPDEAQEIADFVDSCRQDMREPWEDTLSQVLGFLPYGYQLMEVVLKRRLGDRTKQSSAHDDGRIGWDDWSPRPADTIERWVFDDWGYPVAIWQRSPSQAKPALIPLSRCLHFKAGGYRDSPEGTSVLRAAHEDWDAIRKLQLIEAIGIERDLAGLPVALLPAQYLGQNRTPEQTAVFNAVKAIVTGVRNNDQAGVIFPLERDDKGNPTFEFKLLSAGGERAFDTSAIIARRTTQMTRVLLADFMTLGQNAAGSYALSKSKTDLFITAIQAWLDLIADVVNRQAIAPLIRVNAIDPKYTPRLAPGIPDEADLPGLGGYFTALWPMLQTLEREDQLNITDMLLDTADLPQLAASREALAEAEKEERKRKREERRSEPEIPEETPEEPAEEPVVEGAAVAAPAGV